MILNSTGLPKVLWFFMARAVTVKLKEVSRDSVINLKVIVRPWVNTSLRTMFQRAEITEKKSLWKVRITQIPMQKKGWLYFNRQNTHLTEKPIRSICLQTAMAVHRFPENRLMFWKKLSQHKIEKYFYGLSNNIFNPLYHVGQIQQVKKVSNVSKFLEKTFFDFQCKN